MIKLTSIKNKELVRLLQSSYKFRSLPKNKQKAHIARIAKLSDMDQARTMAFLREENAKETRQRIEKIQKAYSDVIKLEKDFIAAHREDKAKMKKILTKIK